MQSVTVAPSQPDVTDANLPVSQRQYRPRFGLRSPSTSAIDYSLPRLRTKFGERAFSYAGPSTWNALPDNIHTVDDPAKFRKLLISHYFSAAFNICRLLLALVLLTVVIHLWSSCDRRTINPLMMTTMMVVMMRGSAIAQILHDASSLTSYIR